MTASWNGLGWGPWPETAEVPQGELTESTRARADLPSTLRPVHGAGVVQRPVFDPSMRHHAKAMRAGEPQFRDPRDGARWYAARRTAVGHVLSAVAESRWAEHLVLRGSTLLRAWYGEAAREPGDLDFVVVPSSWEMAEHRTTDMLEGIADAAEQASGREPGDLRINARGRVCEEIWTYERVPGMRMVLPWADGDLPGGTVQLDFVFSEPLPVDPEAGLLPRPDGGEPVLLLAATPELSLAWKLGWLLSDCYPQSKDLYDAVLLAESGAADTLTSELLCTVVAATEPYWAGRPLTADRFRDLDGEVDWREFRKEYPHLAGDAGERGRYLERLVAALDHVLDQAS